jgi:magnesium transporter
MISATFTGLIINRFEDALVTFTALTAFIPMLMNTAGNAGSQASVTVIRGLSLGEIKFSDIFRIVFKEFRVSLLAGAALSVANFIKIWAFDIGILKSDISLLEAAVVCITIFVSVLFSKIVGCALPILAKKLRLEPEVMASPFITTIVDVLVLMVYFTIAHLLLM